MTPERWAVIKEVFAEAIGCEPRARDAFVAARCGADVELRHGVERLLECNAAGGSFIDESPVKGLVAELASRGRFSGAARGRYRFGRRIATGGMGEVYEATEIQTGRRVAIKVLTEEGINATERLKREAAHASELKHPKVCEVYEVAEDESGAYIAMEFLEGTNLVDALMEDGVDSSTTLSLALQLGEAIAHAHDHNIVHRDLKSANVMLLADGQLKVLDFGLARRLPREVESAVSVASFTDAGVIAGTLSYLAPELLKGERADNRSDIWAFGIILHELLTGRQPFGGKTPFELASAILREPPQDVPTRASAGLRVVRDNCLAKDPDHRYQNGSELLSALRAVQAGIRVRRRHAEPRSWRVAAFVGAMAVVGLLTGWWLLAGRHTNAAAPRIVSVAVLPFRDVSTDTGDAYFGDGVAEALIDRLGTVEGIRVLSHESAARFRDERSLTSITRQLSANMIVRGTVQRQTDRVRVTAELFDTSNDRPIWQDTYERQANEILALENEIVHTIADRLGLAPSPARLSALRVVRAVDPLVYEAFLKGRFQWNKRTTGSLEQATKFFLMAIERDPSYAPAHAALADCYNQMGTVMVGTASPVNMRPRARAEAIAAIQADESLAEAHATLGYISHYEWDWPTADREFRRSLELNPNLALARAWYSNFLISRGRREEAIAQVQRAEQIDPFSLVIVTNVGWTMSNARRPQDAIAAYRRALSIDPSYIQARMRLGAELANTGQFEEAIREHQQVVDMTRRGAFGLASLAQSYAKAGRRTEATAILRELLDDSRRTYVSPVNMYLICFLLGDKDNGFEWLAKAFQERSNGLVYLTAEPSLDVIRHDPRFRKVVAQVGLPDVP
jgi:TolB-like protein/Tfp pilus assembly protein PilF